ncbi:hypothetical protein JCM19239_39 [Vibrio variabilis]|uniref:Uncharacterized protein n=1 Tax=Vibrio variabilis TaxID=990271 RepID=A0ABQ0JDH7_9VIBR|nr:hypothetical protein JCM19239_39 [Vibrio variabilis]
MVAVSEVQGIVWVTEHIAGEAIYGSYDRKGKDISSMHPTLEPSFVKTATPRTKIFASMAPVLNPFWKCMSLNRIR